LRYIKKKLYDHFPPGLRKEMKKQKASQIWKAGQDNKEVRPHSSLKGSTPKDFAELTARLGSNATNYRDKVIEFFVRKIICKSFHQAILRREREALTNLFIGCKFVLNKYGLSLFRTTRQGYAENKRVSKQPVMVVRYPFFSADANETLSLICANPK
jgi:hypothetical protein